MVEFDEVAAVRFLEKGGKWQTRQMLVNFVGWFAACFQVLLIVFTGYQPNFVCVDTVFNYTNTSLDVIYDNKCDAFNITENVSAACSGGYDYDVNRIKTIVSEWDLVCGKAYFSETTQLMYTIGMGLGSIFASVFSDMFGRKRTYLILRVFYSVCAFSISFSPNVYCFMVGRLLIGTFGMGLSVVLFVSMVENIPARLRPFAGSMVSIVWAVALCIEAGATYLMRDMSWRTIQIVMSTPTLTFLLEIFFVQESIRWLYANNRTTEASTLLKSAMRMNGIKAEEIMDEMEVMETRPEMVDFDEKREKEQFSIQGKHLENKKISVFTILKNRATRGISIQMIIAWFVNCLVYYAIFFMSDSFTGDRHLNFFINAVVEIPACLSLYGLLKCMSRKKLLVGLHAVCSVALLLGGILMATLEDKMKYIFMMVLSVCGKFAITITFNCLFVYTSEVFPTNFRSSGLGLGSASARVGAFLSPFAKAMAHELPWGPGIIFGGMCLIVTFMFLWVPETKDEKLPQSIGDVETMINKKGEQEKQTRDNAELTK